MIALHLVPKILKAITHVWAPKAYIVSFKLETDIEILEQKSKSALSKYNHQVSHYSSNYTPYFYKLCSN